MRGALVAAGLLAVLSIGCASPRYVGSIGRDDVYSNRGFGLLVNLKAGGVMSRWDALDPSNLEEVPPRLRPKRVREPLDLDGDGLLQVTEATVTYRPTLRLVSRTSSVAKMDLDVQILGSNNASVPLDALVGLDIKRLAGANEVAVAESFGAITRVSLAGEVAGRVVEIQTEGGQQVRLLVADVSDFVGEEGQTRRHIIRLELSAKALNDEMRADFDHVVSGLMVAPRGAPLSKDEKW